MTFSSVLQKVFGQFYKVGFHLLHYHFGIENGRDGGSEDPIILVNSYSLSPIPPRPTISLPFLGPLCSLPCPPEIYQQWWVWPKLLISSAPQVRNPLMRLFPGPLDLSPSMPTYYNSLLGEQSGCGQQTECCGRVGKL